MRRILCIVILVLMLVALFPLNAYASGFYASGKYIGNIQPTGFNFYVDSSAVKAYGSAPFTVAFDWNGSYHAHVSTVVIYPAPAPANCIVISAKSLPKIDGNGKTYYYKQNGDPVTADSTQIYKCKIVISSDKSLFNVNGSFSSTYLKKVIRHEVGHAFLLIHPAPPSFSSVMLPGAPGSNNISATITDADRANLKSKWG